MKKRVDVTELGQDEIIKLIAVQVLGWTMRTNKFGYWDKIHYVTRHGVAVNRWRRRRPTFVWHPGDAVSVLEELVHRQPGISYELKRCLGGIYECRLIHNDNGKSTVTVSGQSDSYMAEAITFALARYALDGVKPKGKK